MTMNNDKLDMDRFVEDVIDAETEIPESLQPDAIVKKLKAEQNRKKKVFRRRFVSIAASLVLVIAGGFTWNQVRLHNIEKEKFEQKDEPVIPTVIDFTKKDKVGDTYHLASSYQEIDKAISDNARSYKFKWDEFFDGGWSSNKDGAAGEEMESATDMNGANTAAGGGQYATTNLMTEGVDESDYVKTDGNYLYYLLEDTLHILDVNDSYKEIAQFASRKGLVSPNGNELKESFREFYLDGERLYVVGTVEEWGGMSIDGDYAVSECCYFNPTINAQSIVYTYDISDRSNPILVASFIQDGYYNSSRKVGEFIYLFSDFGINLTDENYTYKDFVPSINGQTIPADSIYVAEEAYQELVMTSIKTDEPGQVYDNMVVMGNRPRIYVGKESIYLYSNYYEDNGLQGYEWGTAISKFTYKDGVLNGVNAARFKGEIEDSFAINEYDGQLRVLITSFEDVLEGEYYRSTTHNSLFVLDDQLNELGKISDIAEGERVYAARFMGDRAYFVTFLNHDPIFVADLSDVSNPKLLGNIEISGYSDYLHMYDDKLLLGLGYETEEETSQRLGFKLCMFDFSDEEHPMTLDNVVISTNGWCDTRDFDEYKNLLVDPKKNVIGFAGQRYDTDKSEFCYFLYKWEDGKLQELKTFSYSYEEMTAMMEEDYFYFDHNFRGTYINDEFVLLRGRTIDVFDMENDFAEKVEVELK